MKAINKISPPSWAGYCVVTLVLGILFLSSMRVHAEELPPPLIDDMISVYWPGEYPAIIMNDASEPGIKQVDFYSLAYDGAPIKLEQRYETITGQLRWKGGVLTRDPSTDEYFYWTRPDHFFRIDLKSPQLKGGGGSPMSIDLENRTYIYVYPEIGIGHASFVMQASLDDDTPTTLSRISEGLGQYINLTHFYPTGPNEMLIGGWYFDFFVRNRTFRVDYSQSDASVSVVNNSDLAALSIPIKMEPNDVCIVGGGLYINNLYWYNLIEGTPDRAVDVGQPWLCQTDLKHFFGEPYVEKDGPHYYTKIPVVTWENDYTTSSTSTLRIRHPRDDFFTSGTLGIWY